MIHSNTWKYLTLLTHAKLNCSKKNVGLFNCVCHQNEFTNQIFNIFVKTGFGIKKPTMIDIPENQTKANPVCFSFVSSVGTFFFVESLK